MKKTLSILLALTLIFTTIQVGFVTASAAQSGDYTYTLNGTTVEVTKYTGTGGTATIPSTLGGYTVTSIGQDAFAGNKGLSGVSMPNTLLSIGDSAFEGCANLTSVSIPNSVTTIGKYVFGDCAALTSVTIGNSVVSIGKNAFSGCSGLSSVSIPNSVTSIGDNVFRDCNRIATVTFGSGLTSIGASAFKNCTALMQFVVDSGNASFSSSNGVLFNKTKTKLLLFPSAKSGSYSIPSTVRSIEPYAFSSCLGLTDITIPTSVTTIGDDAFSGCTGLSAVTIPNSVSTIGSSAFAGCAGLSEFSIPSSVIGIGAGAFSGCKLLTTITVDSNNTAYSSLDGVLFNNDVTALLQYPTGKSGSYRIPNSVTSVDEAAFWNAAGLTGVTIGSGLTSISSSAFNGCTELLEINVDENNPNYASLDGVLFNKSVTLLMQYPCRKNGDYTIPATVTSISPSAFDGCLALTNVIIPSSVTSIGDSTFDGCTGLKSVAIGVNVTSIGANAFRGCTGLKLVSIPKGVVSIGDNAFSGCTGVETVLIGRGVTTISSSAFLGCKALTMYVVDANSLSFSSLDGVLFSKDKTVLVSYPLGKTGGYSIPTSVSRIGDSAFYACTSLTSIGIGTTVKTIGNSAFFGCTGLTTVSITSGVTSIGNYAFYSCTSLTNVSIGKSVTSIGYDAFVNDVALIAISVDATNTAYCSLDGVLFNKTKTNLIQFPCTKNGSYTILSTVTSIESNAFYGCKGITQFVVDATNKSYSSADGVLFNKAKTSLIKCPSGKVGAYSIPVTVNFIATNAFAGCTLLTKVTIPLGVTSIDEGTFSGCINLNNVIFPTSLTSIGNYAFEACESLTAVIIPASVTSIGRSAFTDCSALTTAYFIGNAPVMGINVFNNTDPTFLVYYISGSTGFSNNWNGYNATTFTPLATPVLTASVTVPTKGSVTVTITYPAEAAKCQYRVGNGVWTKYTGPLTFTENNTVEASCEDDLGIPSQTGRIVVDNIDHTAPIVTGVANNSTYSSRRTITYNEGTALLNGQPFANGDTVTEEGIYILDVVDAVANRTVIIFTINRTPTGLTAVAVNSTSIKVSWNAVSEAAGYEIYRAASATSSYSLYKTITATSYTDTGLLTGNTYYYKVNSYYMSGSTKVTSDQTAYVSVKPTPSAPTGLTAASAGYNSVKLTWTAVSDAKGYAVYRSASATGTFSYLGVVTTNSYTNTGLTTGTTYYYAVRAYSLAGSTKVYGAQSAAVSAKPIPAVTASITVARASSTSIKISYSAVAGASGYEIYRSTSSGGAITYVTATTATSYTNTKLKTGTTYYYKIRAYRTVGSTKIFGGFSAIKSAKP